MPLPFEFNNHWKLQGKHAFLSASKYSWLNYDDEKLERVFETSLEAALGTEKHDVAAKLIKLKVKLPSSSKTLNAYVNDAISFRMTPEQMLYATEHAFGTADAIKYSKIRDTGRYLLRIHDLKTGSTETKFDQLLLYAAFFCIEYHIDPDTIDFELRIYQNDDVRTYIPDPADVKRAMIKTIRFSAIIDQRKAALA